MAILLRSLLALVVVAACVGCGSSPQRWSAQAETNYLSACKSSAVAAGSDATAADALCGCTLRAMEGAYSEVEMSTLEVEMSQSKTLPDKVTKMMGACRVSPSAY